MSASNTFDGDLIARYRKVRVGFFARGFSLHAWCLANGVAMPNARDALLGKWQGPNGFVITNRKFESTLEISRDDIADDKLGLFKPMFAEMGQAARRHPEELVFGLLASGFSTNCYDGQFFFDTDHPVTDADGAVTQVSSFQGGAGTA